jgi:hypothetical protein
MYGLHPLKGKCGINCQEHSSQQDWQQLEIYLAIQQNLV